MKAEHLMNDTFLSRKLQKDPELRKFYQQEKLILDVTELIAKLMEKKKVNKTKLAELLGVGSSHITQLLDGTTNMTLRTIADVFTSLDTELVVNAGSLSLELSQSNVYEAEDETQFVVEVSLPKGLDLLKPIWKPKEKERAAA